MKKIMLFVYLFLSPLLLVAQIDVAQDSIQKKEKALKFNAKQLIIPTVLCTYGVLAIESDYLKLLNTELRNELRESIDEKSSSHNVKLKIGLNLS